MFDLSFTDLPNSVGVGFKSKHFSSLMDAPAPVSWIEVHAENYMGAGGRPLAQLKALQERFPVSVHGVGLSIGGEHPLDPAHLDRLKHLCDWLQPARFSEHLAWSSHDTFFNDLLPLPYNQTTLERIIRHIDQLQSHLGRQILLENPSSYVAFEQSTMQETEFLSEIVAQTGCGLLLDINNIFVSCTNLDLDPLAYLGAIPANSVGEVHVGGHDAQEDEHAQALLIDHHGAPVADPVWALLEAFLAKAGPKPLLIEWDTDVPAWPELHAEALRATKTLERAFA